MRTLISVLIVLSSWSLALAETVPGRWEKVRALSPDTEIVLTLQSGDRFQAVYQGVDSEKIQVLHFDGRQLSYPVASVEKVVHSDRKERDSVWNGLAIGGAAGAAGFLFIHSALCCAPGAHDLPGIALFTAAGMGIGALVDTSVNRREVLYRAPR